MEAQQTNNPEALKERIRKLEEKYAAMGQDLSSYLDGLLYSEYLTYWDYINLDVLLNLQQPRTAFPDEEVFIMYHQITELYFKLCLHEMRQIQEKRGDGAFMAQRLKRMTAYFESLTKSFSIMIEGMEPEQFLKFRMALLPASGFQSAQYRMIEIQATPLIHLARHDLRGSLLEQKADIPTLYSHIYWNQGATELATGKKTLTLRQFESKYGNSFLAMAHKMEGNTLYDMYLDLPDSEKGAELKESLRTFDRQVNIDWPLVHYKSAVRYLKKNPEDIKATGGTNWQKYLPPKHQFRIFFPQLWSAEEKEHWGIPEKMMGS